MKKKLTLKQAWLYLAQAWGNPKNIVREASGFDFGCKVFQDPWGNPAYGLCYSITRLVEQKHITRKTRSTMLAVIEFSVGARGFLYELTRKGAKQRAAFCREQAKKIKKGTQ